jgi:hypothetical protein
MSGSKVSAYLCELASRFDLVSCRCAENLFSLSQIDNFNVVRYTITLSVRNWYDEFLRDYFSRAVRSRSRSHRAARFFLPLSAIFFPTSSRFRRRTARQAAHFTTPNPRSHAVAKRGACAPFAPTKIARGQQWREDGFLAAPISAEKNVGDAARKSRAPVRGGRCCARWCANAQCDVDRKKMRAHPAKKPVAILRHSRARYDAFSRARCDCDAKNSVMMQNFFGACAVFTTSCDAVMRATRSTSLSAARRLEPGSAAVRIRQRWRAERSSARCGTMLRSRRTG